MAQNVVVASYSQLVQILACKKTLHVHVVVFMSCLSLVGSVVYFNSAVCSPIFGETQVHGVSRTISSTLNVGFRTAPGVFMQH